MSTARFNAWRRNATCLFRALVLAGAVVNGAASQPVWAIETGAAGVPRALAETRDYPAIFRHLAEAGITAFMPTFQYQEVPEPVSLGFETDFMPPCTAASPAFAAMRDHGVRLIVPGSLLYPDPEAMPPIQDDPLATIIACTGRRNILGVLSYDEPALNGMPAAATRALYQRVKQIDASLPVIMVHAPVVLDRPEFASRASVAAYFAAVRALGADADIIGFDIYPVPPAIAQIGDPERQPVTDAAAGVSAYAAWLQRELPDKRHFTVLQGFAHTDLYEPATLVQVDERTRAAVRPPSAQEIDAMVSAAAAAGHDIVVWWGQAALPDTDRQPWPAILDTARRSR